VAKRPTKRKRDNDRIGYLDDRGLSSYPQMARATLYTGGRISTKKTKKMVFVIRKREIEEHDTFYKAIGAGTRVRQIKRERKLEWRGTRGAYFRLST